MLGFIIENKFIILVISEALGWFFLFLMGYYRYWNKHTPKLRISMCLSGFFGYVPHFIIPIFMCIHERSLSALVSSWEAIVFDFIIIGIIILLITKGKNLEKKVDCFMYRFTLKYKKTSM